MSVCRQFRPECSDVGLNAAHVLSCPGAGQMSACAPGRAAGAAAAACAPVRRHGQHHAGVSGCGGQRAAAGPFFCNVLSLSLQTFRLRPESPPHDWHFHDCPLLTLLDLRGILHVCNCIFDLVGLQASLCVARECSSPLCNDVIAIHLSQCDCCSEAIAMRWLLLPAGRVLTSFIIQAVLVTSMLMTVLAGPFPGVCRPVQHPQRDLTADAAESIELGGKSSRGCGWYLGFDPPRGPGPGHTARQLVRLILYMRVYAV